MKTIISIYCPVCDLYRGFSAKPTEIADIVNFMCNVCGACLLRGVDMGICDEASANSVICHELEYQIKFQLLYNKLKDCTELPPNLVALLEQMK